MTTTLIADDEPDMRMLIRVVIDIANEGLRIIGEAVDGVEALAAYRAIDRPDPDVVVLDNRMPGLTGLEVAEQILAERPDQVVILYSAFLDDEIREQARALGIRACLSKQEVERVPERIRELLAS